MSLSSSLERELARVLSLSMYRQKLTSRKDRNCRGHRWYQRPQKNPYCTREKLRVARQIEPTCYAASCQFTSEIVS
jgi:hypothetical protein